MPSSEPGSGFRLLDPDGPAEWARESDHAIAWAAGGAPADARVLVEESSDGAHFAKVADAPASQGRVVWTAPKDGESARRVRVTPSWGGGAWSFDLRLTPSQKRDYRWVCVAAKTPFSLRDGAGALVFHDRMWLIGGWNPGLMPRLTANDVWSTTNGVDWTNDKPQTFTSGDFDADADWEGRHTGGYAVLGDRMWIVGGDPLQGHYQGDVWSSSDGKTWTRATKTTPWGQRALQYTVAFGDRLWVMGGQTMTDFVASTVKPYEIYDDVWSSKDGALWERVAAGPRWQPRAAIMQSAVMAGRVWVVGGGTYDSVNEGRFARQYLTDVWSSADGVAWRRDTATTPWPAREYHSVVAWDDRLWTIAGYSDEGNLDGAWYSSDGKNWYPTSTPWGPRHAASVWVYQDAVWLTAGGDVDVWRLERTR
jgi:hypothetical protein